MTEDIRIRMEAFEQETLSKFAAHSVNTGGRKNKETPSPVRTEFQRDKDRIVYSNAFRRLKHKTQVFLSPEGDHYRTRMTHTIEVSQIARTIARALRLNEDLTEAVAMGHDLGHTPFGHAGEYALSFVCPLGFSHNEQSLRVVEELEKNGVGLNLTAEVRDGIKCHTGDELPQTLEGQIVRYADKIAYVNHDIDDAIRAGLLDRSMLPKDICGVLGSTLSERINTLVCDMIESSAEGSVCMSQPVEDAMMNLREFMFERVYRNPVAKGEEGKARAMLVRMYEHYAAHPEDMPDSAQAAVKSEGIDRVVCDYIAGMSDRYAVKVYNGLFVPRYWQG